MTTPGERGEPANAPFTDALAGQDGTGEPMTPPAVLDRFADPLADPAPGPVDRRLSVARLSAPRSWPQAEASPIQVARPVPRRVVSALPPPARFAPPAGPAVSLGVGVGPSAPLRPLPQARLPPAARPAAIRPVAPGARTATYPAATPSAISQNLRAQARQRAGSSTRKKSGGAWGCLVALIIIGFSSGLVQRIIGVISDLLHHR